MNESNVSKRRTMLGVVGIICGMLALMAPGLTGISLGCSSGHW